MSGKTAIVPQGRKSPLTVQDVARMSGPEKLGEAIRRSLPYLPVDLRQLAASLLEPQALATIAAVFVVWGGAHFLGFGFAVDFAISFTSIVFSGAFIFDGVSSLCTFGKMALNARSDRDLEQAGQHLTHAVLVLGPSILYFSFWLKARKYYSTHPENPAGADLYLASKGRHYAGGIKPWLVNVEHVMTQKKLRVVRPAMLPGGQAMLLRSDGLIMVARNQPLSAQKRALFQAIARRYLLPQAHSLQRFRARLSATGYERLALLRYLELVLADGFAQLRLNGLTSMLRAIRFPLQGGYVTVSQFAIVGNMIGTITTYGTMVYVAVSYNGVWDGVSHYGDWVRVRQSEPDDDTVYDEKLPASFYVSP